MRRITAMLLMLAVLFSAAAAENALKAPDYILEGFDGDITGRIWDSNLFFARMQEKTGISFQFRQYTDYDRWKERKKDILEGADLPDVLFKAELSSAEVRDLYGAGHIIDLSPYLEQYAPDLWKLLEEHPEWKAAVTLPDGSIPALPAINRLQSNDAMWINASWLKKLGLEAPKTAEELTEVLRVFRDRDPNGNYQQDEVPLTFLSMWELRFLGHAFGMTDNDYYVSARDGKVTSSLTSGENRAFLTWLHTLWEEGLLDSNGFSGVDSLRKVTDDSKPMTYGMLLSSTPLTILPEAALGQYTLLEPMTWEGRQVYRDLFGDLTRGTFAITSSCREPEKLVAWVNTLYTEEGSHLAFYGLEGEDYDWNEDGYWEWHEDMETVANITLPEHTISEGGTAPGISDSTFQMKYREENTRTMIEQLTRLKQFSVIPYPPVTLSAEDEARVAAIQTELSSYAETAMARFVTGDTELNDETWADFCRTAEEKGLTEMIAIWQKYIQ